MNNKLLTDVAGILAELGVSYQQADEIGGILNLFFNDGQAMEDFVNIASNAPIGGECSCG